MLVHAAFLLSCLDCLRKLALAVDAEAAVRGKPVQVGKRGQS